jgi:CRP-like cAMP-binding protein
VSEIVESSAWESSPFEQHVEHAQDVPGMQRGSDALARTAACVGNKTSRMADDFVHSSLSPSTLSISLCAERCFLPADMITFPVTCKTYLQDVPALVAAGKDRSVQPSERDRPMKPNVQRKTANQLLNSLQPAAFERIAKKLTRVKLRPKEIVYKPNQPIEHVLFPENTVLCLLTLMANGDTIEAATVGREGASWISASVGAPSMPCETIAVIEGTALKLPVADLERELKDNDHFRHVLTEYSHALLIACMRTSACNGLHKLQERCARWILTTLDRVDTNRFAVTKEFLAQLLGTNRPTVSVMVSALEKAGMLNVEGRCVTVADRKRLKEAACECYEIIRKHYEPVG